MVHAGHLGVAVVVEGDHRPSGEARIHRGVEEQELRTHGVDDAGRDPLGHAPRQSPEPATGVPERPDRLTHREIVLFQLERGHAVERDPRLEDRDVAHEIDALEIGVDGLALAGRDLQVIGAQDHVRGRHDATSVDHEPRAVRRGLFSCGHIDDVTRRARVLAQVLLGLLDVGLVVGAVVVGDGHDGRGDGLEDRLGVGPARRFGAGAGRGSDEGKNDGQQPSHGWRGTYHNGPSVSPWTN